MKKILIEYFVILITVNYCSTLKCLDCQPDETNSDKCKTIRSDITEEQCKENGVCIAMYFINSPNRDTKPGVYRSCYYPKNTMIDPCDDFKNENNFNISDCASCNTDLCNNQELKNSPFKCFNCNPNDENCVEIGDNKPKEEECHGYSGDFVCISSANENVKEEVYRSCFKKGQTEKDACDVYKETFSNRTITNCKSCTENLCNDQQIQGSPLKCHSCKPNPDDPNACEVVDDNEPKYEECQGPARDFVCISVYVQNSDKGETEGTYRSCYNTGENVKDSCDLYREEHSDLEVTDCEYCSDDLCNEKKLKNDADSTFKYSMLLLVNIILVLNVCN